MKYSLIRDELKDGDIVLTSSSGFISLMIRVFSAGSWSHVGVLFWEDDALYIAEMREFAGHRITHASTWIDEQLTHGAHVKIGVAPSRVRHLANPAEFIQKTRQTNPKYSYWLLPIVWLSRALNIKLAGNRGFVCSHYVQRAWDHNGKSLLPSDLEKHCERTYNISEL